MTTSDWMVLAGVIIAVLSLAGSYHLYQRQRRHSVEDAQVEAMRTEASRRATVTVDVVRAGTAREATCLNAGEVDAFDLRIELVDDPAGRIAKHVGPDLPAVLPPGGLARTRLIAVAQLTGRNADLVWRDASGRQERVRLPEPVRR